VPTCAAAWLLRIPIFLHESNAFPGLATRFLVNTLRAAARLYLGFARAKTFLTHPGPIVTGNPVRQGIAAPLGGAAASEEKARCLERLFPGSVSQEEEGAKRVCICFMGGSLGSERINQVVRESLGTFLDRHRNAHIIWQTGQRYFSEARGAATVACEGEDQQEEERMEDQETRLKIVPFLDDMALVYGACDLVVCRSGAITCSELIASRTPSLLIPSPNVTDDHQKRNAQVLEAMGGAALLEERDLSAETLVAAVESMLGDGRQRLREMEATLEKAPQARAGETISESILKDLDVL